MWVVFYHTSSYYKFINLIIFIYASAIILFQQIAMLSIYKKKKFTIGQNQVKPLQSCSPLPRIGSKAIFDPDPWRMTLQIDPKVYYITVSK